MNTHQVASKSPGCIVVIGGGFIAVLALLLLVAFLDPDLVPHGPGILSPAPTPAPTGVDALAKPAREVLEFLGTTETDTIQNIVEQNCGFGDYVGSKNFPGQVTVAAGPEGSSFVTWTLTKCDLAVAKQHDGGVSLKYRIAEDGAHVTYLDGQTEMLSR